METYKIETNKNEIEIVIAALSIYKSELFDTMLQMLKNKNDAKYNALSRRHLQTIAIMRKLQEINDPPF